MLFRKYRMELTGAAIGLVAGWSYWFFVGCASGTCPITSSPWVSSIYGATMGALLFSMLDRRKSATEK